MPNWQSILFDAPAAPRAAPRGRDTGQEAVSPYDKTAIQRLIEAEAVRQGVNPAIVVGIAKQESWLNPNAVGDNGKSLGLFQLQRAAAIDAGIDPTRRGELHENIRGGVAYFKQKLAQSGGNVEQALSRYNRGTPTYRGIGDPHYVENVLAKIEGGAPRQGLVAQTAAPGPRDWGSELGLSGESPRTPAAPASTGQRDWRTELFPTAAASTPAPAAPVSPSPSAPGAGSAPTDWAATLGLG